MGTALLSGHLPIGGACCGGKSRRSGFFRETLSVSIEALRRTPYLLLLLAFALVSEKSPDHPDPPWIYWRFRLISARTQPGPQPGPPPFRHPLWARDPAPPPGVMGQQRPARIQDHAARIMAEDFSPQFSIAIGISACFAEKPAYTPA